MAVFIITDAMKIGPTEWATGYWDGWNLTLRREEVAVYFSLEDAEKVLRREGDFYDPMILEYEEPSLNGEVKCHDRWKLGYFGKR